MYILKRVLISIMAAFVFTATAIGLIIAMPAIIEWLNSLDGRIQLGALIFIVTGIAAYINTYQLF